MILIQIFHMTLELLVILGYIQNFINLEILVLFFINLVTLIGAFFNAIDQFIFRGKLPFTLNHPIPDHESLLKVSEVKKIGISLNQMVCFHFDKAFFRFIYVSNHEEDQPCHLQLKDPNIPILHNLPLYDEPAQRYLPCWCI